MKKIIYVLLASSLLLLSCSSNDNSGNSNLVLLRKSTSSGTLGSETTNLFYNGNKIINAISSNGQETKFYYTGDLITKYEIYENTILIRTVLFNYNSQNNLISGIELNHNNNQGTKTTLTYNSNSIITYNMYDGDLTSQTGLWVTFTATLSNGEITTFKDENSNSLSTCTYDSKNRTFKNVLGIDKIKLHLGSGTYANLGGVLHNLIQQNNTSIR